MCNCQSSNRPDVGTEPQEKVKLPEFMSGGETIEISVDGCMVQTIQHLWDNKVVTQGCCCGHNGDFGGNPSIVLDQGINETQAAAVRKLIREVDPRDFNLYSWTLVGL